MISKVRIRNFQSHRNTELEFNKGLNVIIGPTDSGKTALIRALKWVITNRPGGDSFRSHWGGETEVGITIDGKAIARRKSNTENSYAMNENLFKAFGQDVPEEIQQALKMNEVNLQQQMDSPFLLSETPGAVALHFNKVAKLDVIDKALNNVQSNIREITQTITYTEKTIKEKIQDLTKFENLNSLEFDLERVEKLIEIRERDEMNTKHLSHIVSKIETVQNRISEKEPILSIEKELDGILDLYGKRKVYSIDYQKLKKLSLELFYKSEEVKKAEIVLLSEKSINDVLQMYQERSKILSDLKDISKLSKSIEQIKIMSENKEKGLFILEKEFKDNFPDVCPLCNSEIK